MYRRKHHRVAALLTAVAVLAFFAGSVQAADTGPAGMTKAEYRAQMLRSQALNQLHGNAVTRLSPRVFEELYQAGANRMAPQEFAALVVRSEALNRSYGLDRTSQQAQVGEQPTGSGNGFDWGDFGIGAATMLGLVLLSGVLLTGAHFGRRISSRPRAAS